MNTTTRDRKIFEERAISEDVERDRPYTRYEKGQLEWVRSHLPMINPLAQNQLQVLRDIVNQSGGYLIRRHVPPGVDAPPITPEFRPDPIMQHHDAGESRSTITPSFVTCLSSHGGAPCVCWPIFERLILKLRQLSMTSTSILTVAPRRWSEATTILSG